MLRVLELRRVRRNHQSLDLVKLVYGQLAKRLCTRNVADENCPQTRILHAWVYELGCWTNMNIARLCTVFAILERHRKMRRVRLIDRDKEFVSIGPANGCIRYWYWQSDEFEQVHRRCTPERHMYNEFNDFAIPE